MKKKSLGKRQILQNCRLLRISDKINLPLTPVLSLFCISLADVISITLPQFINIPITKKGVQD